MKVVLELGGDEFNAFVKREADRLQISIDGETFDVKLGDGGVVTLGGSMYKIELGERELTVNGERLPYKLVDVKTGAAGGEGGARGARVKPPMPGKIVTVAIQEGEEVRQGQVLVILEAMKMQNEICAPAAGTVKKIHVKPGQNVEGKDVLVELE